MIFKKSCFPIIMVFCILAGCGHYASKSDYNIVPNKGLAEPNNNEAVVYFLSVERDTLNSPVVVFRDSNAIGALSGGTYFYDLVKPGKYQYWVDSGLIQKSRERVDLITKPGQRYYLRWFPGGFYVVAKLDLISEDVAVAHINSLDFIEFRSP